MDRKLQKCYSDNSRTADIQTFRQICSNKWRYSHHIFGKKISCRMYCACLDVSESNDEKKLIHSHTHTHARARAILKKKKNKRNKINSRSWQLFQSTHVCVHCRGMPLPSPLTYTHSFFLFCFIHHHHHRHDLFVYHGTCVCV